jgi:molybdopterin converting factor subunit 1
MADRPLRLLYFAWLRERVGRSEEELPLPPTVTTVGSLMAWLQARDPAHEALFANARLVRVAVNQDFADHDTPITPGDEVAFFPPVTGG